MSAARVLHLLSQRPSLTGSGVTLEALVRQADRAGWEQRVVCGLPAGEPVPGVGGLTADRVFPLRFGGEPAETADGIRFPIPGMSDVMPYASSRFSALTSGQLSEYRTAWHAHLRPILETFRPEVIHSHHAWILSSLACRLAAETPVVLHGHGTGLRQIGQCPHLVAEVSRGCRLAAALLALHDEHARRYPEVLGLPADRAHVVGAGYDDGIFHPRGREPDSGQTILFAGKLSRAKGLHCLLDAFERCLEVFPGATLAVAGSASGPEADELQCRMSALSPRVRPLGRLSQVELATRMRRAAVFVLPSFYEGLPLVLVEALACGCRLVSNDLPGVRRLRRCAEDELETVAMPRLVGLDTPRSEDLPAYVEALGEGLVRALRAGPSRARPRDLEGRLRPFTWEAVFERVQLVWRRVIAEASRGDPVG